MAITSFIEVWFEMCVGLLLAENYHDMPEPMHWALQVPVLESCSRIVSVGNLWAGLYENEVSSAMNVLTTA